MIEVLILLLVWAFACVFVLVFFRGARRVSGADPVVR
jgi:hypothetical protein